MFDNVFVCVVMKTNKTNNNSNSHKDQRHNKKVTTPQNGFFSHTLCAEAEMFQN